MFQTMFGLFVYELIGRPWGLQPKLWSCWILSIEWKLSCSIFPGATTTGSSPHKGLTGMSLHPQMRDSVYYRSTISQHGVSAGLGTMLLSEEEDETDGSATMWTGHTHGQNLPFSVEII